MAIYYIRANLILFLLKTGIMTVMCDANEGSRDRFFDATEVDEGRPLDVGRQRPASNQAVRLGFKRPWS